MNQSQPRNSTDFQGSISTLQKHIEAFESQAKKLSNYRLWTFISGLAVFTIAFQFLGTSASLMVFILFSIVFSWLVHIHKKYDHSLKLFSFFKAYRETQKARLDLAWEKLPELQAHKPIFDHPFENDLVVTGQRSLLRLLNHSLSEKGESALHDLLLREKPQVHDALNRQKIVQDLAQLPHFRERLAWNAYKALSFGKAKLAPEVLLNWLKIRAEQTVNIAPKLGVSSVVAVINVILLLLNISGVLAAWWLVGLIVQYILQSIYSKDIAHLLGDAEKVNENLAAFGQILSFIENHKLPQTSALTQFLAPIRTGEQTPTTFLAAISTIAARAALTQGNALVGFLVNLFIPWDLYHSNKLNILSDTLTDILPKWISCFTQLEVYLSLAEFAWLNPHYTYPTFKGNESNTPLEATALGHPLITEKQKVNNNFKIHSVDETILLTGSNMSGKSTFLRTLGVNIILAYTGAPVNATHFSIRPMRLFTCINVSDSLADGFSYFYAEVRRLKQLLDATNESEELPVFYLIDEIFRGTNNKERLIGSQSYVKALSQSKGFGLVSTHDLELVKLEDNIGALKNYHFRESIEQGKMKFEYQIHEGPSPTTNALRIMQLEGLPVPNIELE